MRQDIDVQQLYRRRRGLYDLMIAVIGHRRSLRDFFLRCGVLGDGMRVLDAGCGSGALTRAMMEAAKARHQRADFYGFDLTPKMLEGLPENGAKFVQADVMKIPETLPAGWRDFDLIATSGMLEYLPKGRLAEALGRLRGLLKTDGTLVVFISRDRWFNRAFIGRFWKANLYTKEEARAAFSSADLFIRSIEPFRGWGFAIVATARR